MAFDSREQGWADLKIYVNGQFTSGARGVRYKDSVDTEALYAAGTQPRAIQSGNQKYEGELILLKSEIDKLNDGAVAAGYTSLSGLRGIDIVCTYAPAGTNLLRTVRCKFCVLSEYEVNLKQGDKFAEVTIPFMCLGVENV